MTQEFIHQLIITGPETSQTFVAPAGPATIGRQAGNGLLLNHFLVSRRHAQLDCTASSCKITDLESANGTIVNGERLTPGVAALLAPGAVIQIGPFTLTYEQILVEPLPEAVAPPFIVPEEAREPVVHETPEPVAAPPRPSQPERPQPERPSNGAILIPPGLSLDHSRYLEYLPGIYHTDFMTRLLAMFESILTPIEWNVDNFDLYLDPRTAPAGFLPWLANWFEVAFDDTWSEAQRRMLLAEAHHIYARRGTKWALGRVLEIYLGRAPEIDDQAESLEPFTFAVNIPLRQNEVNQALLEQIIEMNKPAHTTYKLRFRR
jgi:phage tail-like protein